MTDDLRDEFVALEQQYFEDMVAVAQANGADYDRFVEAVEIFYDGLPDHIDVVLSYWRD